MEVAMNNPTSPAKIVLDEVATWPGITTKPTSRGATAIVFDGHELGHVHANRGTLDLPLPADRRAQVLEAARAKEWFSGWVTKQLASRADADDGIALLRESYDALHALLTSSEKSHS
jgi:Luciferase